MTEVSVVICAYTLDRWDELKAAVASVRAQTLRPHEIFVVIDGNEELEQRARAIAGVTVVPNAKAGGLSGARMTGAELATAPVIAFIDDDAIADVCWLEELMEAYRDPRVLGAGGHIEPLWQGMPPRWFPAEFNWVVGCTYRGMPVRDGQVRNVIGANMSVRSDVLRHAGGFAAKLGRQRPGSSGAGISGSCEETEFCIRAARLYPSGIWAYRPKARVMHVVPKQRMTWHYFVKRCWMEGNAKAVLTRALGGQEGLASERRYALNVLTNAVLREIGSCFRGQAGGVQRAGAICAGLTITTAAYTRARIACVMPRGDPAATPISLTRP